MTEQLPAGRTIAASVFAMNTPAELFATHTEGALTVTLDPPAICVDSADAPAAAEASPQVAAFSGGLFSGFVAAQLGTGANAGKVRFSASSQGNVVILGIWATGWWR